jgi:ankyrin repeat protein
VLETLKVEFRDYFNKAIRLWNNIIILDNLGEYEKADERLLEVRSGYMTAFSKKHLPWLNSQCG